MNEPRADVSQRDHADPVHLKRSIEQLEAVNQRQARDIDRLQARLAETEQTLATVYASSAWRAWRSATRTLQRVRALRARGLGLLARVGRSASAGGGVKALRLLPDYLRVRHSGLFDRAWYLNAYPDVAAAGTPALLHFLRRGLAEGRSPGPDFDTAFYLDANPDVAASATPALLHYLRHGKREGRAPVGVNGPRGAGAAAGRHGRIGDGASRAERPGEPHALAEACESARRMLACDAVLAHAYRPLVSILLPTWNTPVKYLKIAVASVLDQNYPHWELCIVDDGSTAPALHACLDELATLDARIRIERAPSNGGISAATNRALEMAGGEFVAMLDHDDVLDPDALIEIVAALQADPALDAVYTDQDYIESDGTPGEALLKPDWAPLLACGVMYVGHLLAVRRTIAREAGGFDSRFDRVQDFEFMLRVGERTSRIHHVPRILYHWRRIPGSVAYDGNAKGRIEALQAKAVSTHLERIGVGLHAVPHALHAHRVTLEPTAPVPESRVLVLQAPSQASDAADPVPRPWPDATAASARHSFEVRRMPVSPDDASGVPGEATPSAGAWLALQVAEDGWNFLVGANVAGRPLDDDWFERLATFADVDGVGVVSATIVSADMRVVDAGMIVSPRAGLLPALSGRHVDEDGYAGSLACAREVSAVSGRFCVVSRRALARCGGFDASIATAAAAWTDLSLRCLREGLRSVVVPQVRVVVRNAGTPAAAPSPDDVLDRLLIEERWLKPGFVDRYHNPAFAADGGGYRIPLQRQPDARVAA
ncbi:MAG: glycosyltransferase [Lautropia sp.]